MSYMHNFEFCSGNWNCDTWGYSYDCDSIMHYAKDQMSKSGKDTIGNTLESEINIPPWINVAPGTFGQKQ